MASNDDEKQARTIRIGSRTSRLALVQTEHVAQLIRNKFSDCRVEIVEMSTKGDRVLDVALSKIGDKGLFTQELEDALHSGQIDMAVHSLKDMPTRLPAGLCIGAVSARESVADVVILAPCHLAAGVRSLDDLPVGSCVGTSSLRRIAQLQERYNRGAAAKQFVFRSVRGNLQTRLAKLDDRDQFGYDAIVLAEAGLRRLGLFDRVHQVLDCRHVLPAVGQGALAVECRADDEPTLALLSETVNDRRTAVSCEAERAFLRTLEGGCQVPVGCYSQLNDDATELTIHGVVAAEDGSKVYRGSLTGALSADLGVQLALALKAQGCDDVLVKR